jgi:hypothetical protein
MRRAILLSLCAFLPGVAAAQSSQFGVRGLGAPGRQLSARAVGSGGAFGLFDAESELNPAALSTLTSLTISFTGVGDSRHVENPAGTATVRENRFPLLGIGGPLNRRPLVLGVGFSNYTSRDFTLVSADTIQLRGAPVPVSDIFSSRGGMSDLRFAGAFKVGDRWAVGASFHVITGSNRIVSRRIFVDSSYVPANQKSEISFAGVGFDIGVVRTFGANFSVAAVARSDGHADIDRDSTRVSQVDLPSTFGFGVRWRPARNFDVASQVIYRTWSAANSDLISQGGVGAENTVQVALGGEVTRGLFRQPLRFGVRYGTMPFPLAPGEQPEEIGVSIGSGVRFAQQRAGIDLGFEHVWRSAGAYSERALMLTVSVTVKP